MLNNSFYRAALCANQLQVLQLVLHYVQDFRTLRMCSCVSQLSKHYVQEAVKLSAPLLVKELHSNEPSSVVLKDFKPQYARKCLLWLCKTAGPAVVNSPPVAQSVLMLSKTADDLVQLGFGDTLAQGGTYCTPACNCTPDHASCTCHPQHSVTDNPQN